MAEVEDAFDALTPDEWWQIIRADEDGPLGPCCAAVSDLRDSLVGLLRSPIDTTAVEVARRLTTDDGHSGYPSMRKFTDRLTAMLDESRPNWRTERLPDDDDLATFEAQMILAGRVGGGIPRWQRQPRGSWNEAFQQAASYIALPLGGAGEIDATFNTAHRLLAEAGESGAPPRALLGLYQAFQVAMADALEREGRDGQ